MLLLSQGLFMKKQAKRYKTDDDGDEEEKEAQYVYYTTKTCSRLYTIYGVTTNVFLIFLFWNMSSLQATDRSTNNNKIMYSRLAGSTRQKYFF